MNRLFPLILLFLFLSAELLAGQSFPELPRTAEEFEERVSIGTIRFSVPANSGNYDIRFDEKTTFEVPAGIRIFFEKAPDNQVFDNQTSVFFENVEFIGNNTLSMEFHLEHPVDIQIRNSSFINTGRLWFRMGYEDELYNDDQQTKILLENNYLESTNFDFEAYYSQLLFTRLKGADDTPLRSVAYNNITIKDNHLKLLRDAPASNYVDDDFYIKRTFTSGIHFNRASRSDFINDVLIDGNLVEMNNTPGFDTPIWALNIENRGFTGSDNTNFLYDHLKDKNQNITITNNSFLTQSKYQSGAAFIMGPIRGLNYSHNLVDGFTRYQIHNCPQPDDSLCEDFRWGYEPRPVVVLYGARLTENVNNIYDAVVNNNTIRTGTSGFRINGMVNGHFEKNEIYMYPEIELPPFYNNRNYEPLSDRSAIKVSSGHAWDAKYKSRNIDIINNTIYCNNEDNCAAIRIFHGTNVKVVGNSIFDFTSYGIQHESNITWADEHYVGKIIITDNFMSTTRYFHELSTDRKLYFGYLSSYKHLELDYLIPPAAISFSRLVPSNKLYQIQNESIIIENNRIQKKDTDTFPVFFENGVITENSGHVSFKNYNAEIFDLNNYSIHSNLYNEFIYDKLLMELLAPDNQFLFGDFNGNGITDLLRVPMPGMGAELWFGGNGTFLENYSGIWSREPNYGQWYKGRFTQADINEIMSVQHLDDQNSKLRFFKPLFSEETERWSFELSNSQVVSIGQFDEIKIADFNRNGFSDIVFFESDSNHFHLFLNDGSAYPNQPETIQTASIQIKELIPGDFSGNGYDDLIIQDHNEQLWFLHNIPGQLGFDSPTALNGIIEGSQWIAADFNGDGNTDLLRPPHKDSSDNSLSSRLWLGTDLVAGNTTNWQNWILNNKKGLWFNAQLFNDERADLIFYDQNSGEFQAYQNNSITPNPTFYEVEFTGLVEEREPFDENVSFQLFQNYPNPFNNSTILSFVIAESGNVQIDLFSVTGQRIRRVTNGQRQAGYHSISINAEGLASGMYLYRAIYNGKVQTGKMMLVK